MSTLISVPASALTEAAENILTNVKDVEDIFDRIANLLEMLRSSSSWNGNAFEALSNATQDNRVTLSVVMSDLKVLSHSLKSFAEEMDRTDQEIAAQILKRQIPSTSGILAGSTGSINILKPNGKKMVTSTWSDIVDNYREDHGLGGEKSELSYSSYSNVETGTTSVLGTGFIYKKYMDYSSLHGEAVDGKSFYSIDTGFKKQGHRIDFESNDGSGINGTLVANGISLYGDGEFDLAKGNAYFKAGAEYQLLSGSLDFTADDMTLSLTAGVGAGGHFDAGVHDGKFTIDASVGLGLDVGVKLEIDYENIWQGVKDFGNFAINSFKFW